jgi:hypothetical protein
MEPKSIGQINLTKNPTQVRKQEKLNGLIRTKRLQWNKLQSFKLMILIFQYLTRTSIDVGL